MDKNIIVDHNTKFTENKPQTNVDNPADAITSSNGTGNDNGIGNGTGALSKNDVNVDVDPDSKDNQVYINFCSCMINLSCFNSTNDK